jgi:hypothetical protein
MGKNPIAKLPRKVVRERLFLAFVRRIFAATARKILLRFAALP